MEEAELLSSTLVKHLEFRGNFEAIVDKELAFSEYNDEGLLGKKTLQCQQDGRSIPRGTQKGQLNLDHLRRGTRMELEMKAFSST